MRFVVRRQRLLAVVGGFVALQALAFYAGRLSIVWSAKRASDADGDTAAGDNAAAAALLRAHPVAAAALPTPPLPAVYLLTLVMSAPDEADARQTARETWLALNTASAADARHAFVLGVRDVSAATRASLDAEHARYGDLVYIERLIDTYDNLALKTALALEATTRLFDFRFVLKTDTDSFVRVGHLIKALRDIEHPYLYYGFLDGRAKPFRRGKWRESAYVVCDRYLPYQLGGGYVLSHKLATFVADHVNMLRYFRAEDVSVGVWLASVQAKYVHDPRFDTEWQSRGCNNRYLITHKHSDAQLRQLANNVRTHGRLCEREYQTRPSYV